MTVVNPELVMVDEPGGPVLTAIVDAPASAAAALADAVALERDHLGSGALEAEGILTLRALGELAERLRPPQDAEMTVLRLDAGDVASACDAAEHFLQARDVEAYQAPEDRERIAAVRDLLAGLRDVQARMMLAGLDASDAALT